MKPKEVKRLSGDRGIGQARLQTLKSRASLRTSAAQKRKQKPKPEPPAHKFPYKLENVTKGLSEVPETLEVHPTKSAPTLIEIEDEIARAAEQEKLKFFTVPIKVYEPDENGMIDFSKKELTDDDKIELNRYGSRVVMDAEGHVVGLEVREDLLGDNRKRHFAIGFCQCIEQEYEVSENLKNSLNVRRKFMAQVLFLESFLRMPSLIWLYLQFEYDGIHDFVYQQKTLLFFMISIIQGTRLTSIRLSEIGRYEPCRTILTMLTSVGYCLVYAFLTSLLQQTQSYFIEYKEYEDPIGILTLNKKIHNNSISYPYAFFLLSTYVPIFNFFMCLTLRINKIMNEFGNSFLLIQIILSIIVAGVTYWLVFFGGAVLCPSSWDACQIGFAAVVSCKWAMWRFYRLQQLVRGKVMKVSEDDYQFVATSLSF